MSISDKVQINTHYTRSVNLERDGSSINVVKAYIPTSRALRTMVRVIDSFGVKQAPRAWSLIGPYGSGKSSFSVFLSHLLSNKEYETTQAAYKVLYKSSRKLKKDFQNHNDATNGYLKILLTGAPEPLSLRFVKALSAAADEFWRELKIRGPKKAILSRLQEASTQAEVSVSEIIELFSELQDALKGKASGVLIIIDELGKFLEYEARHYGANDIYLLQTLAEHACGEHEINVMLFVMLHQSFEQYARGLGESLKQEWSKVQGRFEDIPFLEGPEQVLRVVSSAFEQKLTVQEQNTITNNLNQVISVLAKQNALPGVLNEDDAVELFKKCYPLHPITALILPILCQKVAQNERTLFSYLGSQESFGLNKLMEEMDSVDDMIYPYHIYDYFITNQPAVLGDHMTHRRWAEVVTAIERLGDAPPEQINFLKTIGLFNIIGVQGGIKASKELLATLFGSKNKVSRLAKELIGQSIIQFRKYSSEYRVWQGSDFDIEAAIETELSKLGNFSLSNKLNERAELLPIVARRYTIKNGALRYFQPVFIDAQSYKSLQTNSSCPRIIYYLSMAQDDEKLFNETVVQCFSELDIIVLCKNSPHLREATAEVLALENIQNTARELHSDPVAQREFKDRFNAAEYAEQALLRELNDEPQNQSWFWKGVPFVVQNKRQLQEQFSTVLEKVYSKSPIIFNELINKDKPSAQAVAARNKLLIAMLKGANQCDLGFDQKVFPPEKSIYRSVLQKSLLHTQSENGEWQFNTIQGKNNVNDPSNMRHVWQRLVEFVETSESKPCSFIELDRELVAPPYGIKAGLLPILYIYTYFIYQYDLALYENGVYRPYITEEIIERFVKRPDEFTIQRFKIEGLNESIFSQYNKALYGVEGTRDKMGAQRTLLDLARPLAKFMAGLPLYTQKTKRLPKKAIALRQAFNLSKSPVKLIFEEIPRALNINKVDKNNGTSIEQLSKELTNTLKIIKYSYDDLIKREQELLVQAFSQNKNIELHELRRNLAGRVSGLEDYTVDVSGLKAFIMRLKGPADNDQQWLESVLTFLGHKATDKWLDRDQDQAEYRLTEFSRKINDLEKLRVQYEGNTSDEDFDVFLLRSFKKGYQDFDEIVTVSKDQRKAVQDTKARLVKQLQGINGRELQLAALAELVNDFLAGYKESQNIDKNNITNTDVYQLKEA